ncbi:MAG: acetyl-CoA acetyltransferase [Novosphingobium sp.]|nr:acetyl-CoA acetyltransferase [Novosphingobium sp.]
MPADRLPVIVGVGQVNDRPADPIDGMDPVALMVEALRRAEADARACLLSDADTLATVRQISFPDIEDPGKLVAIRIGAARAEISQTALPSGESPVRLLNDAANRIGSGEISIALVCGGEALRTAAARVAASEGGRKLDPVREARHRVHTGYAAEHGLVAPVDVYPLYENALRARLGQTFEEAQRESGEIWALMSRVAADNANAWIRTPVDPHTIVTPSDNNRPIAFPYTKLQVANSSVNQGAALIVASVAEARRRGIPEEKWVYVGNGAAANEPADILSRDRFDRSVSMEVSILKTLELNDVAVDDLAAVELYSCFPCIPKLARRIIGWPVERPVTVFGGLTFGGGPVGNYMSHAMASMVEVLRARSGTALLFGNGGIATYNHSIVLSSQPIAAAIFPRAYDFQADAEFVREPAPGIDPEYIGAARIETWTVHYRRDGTPDLGTVVARTPEGKRTLARLTDAEASRFIETSRPYSDPVGMPARIGVEHGVRTWNFAPAGSLETSQ